MNKLLLILLCLLTFSSLTASRMGRLYYAISESVVEEFVLSDSVIEQEDAFDSIELSMTSNTVKNCDLLYKGSVVISTGKVLFDVCVNLNEDKSFDIAVSERQAYN